MDENNKIFIKKLVVKLTLFMMGLDVIQRFYQNTGLSKQISILLKKDVEEIESPKKVEFPPDDDNTILMLLTDDDTFVRFRETGTFEINRYIKEYQQFKSNVVLMDDKKTASLKGSVNCHVKKIEIQKEMVQTVLTPTTYKNSSIM